MASSQNHQRAEGGYTILMPEGEHCGAEGGNSPFFLLYESTIFILVVMVSPSSASEPLVHDNRGSWMEDRLVSGLE